MQLQISNICFVRIRDLCLICGTSQWNTYNQKHCDETKQRVDGSLNPEHKKKHKQDHDESDRRHWQSGADRLKQTKEETVI